MHGEKKALPYLTQALQVGEQLGTQGLAHDGFVDLVGLINDKAWCLQRCSTSVRIGQVTRQTGHEIPNPDMSDNESEATENILESEALLRRAHYMGKVIKQKKSDWQFHIFVFSNFILCILFFNLFVEFVLIL